MLRGSYGELEARRPYLKMDNQELTKQYSPSQWSKRMGPDEVIQDHIMALTMGSEHSKGSIPFEEGLPYGPGEKQKLDIFAPDSLPPDAPIFVYIHGGYWQALGREMSSFVAAHVVKTGKIHITVGYDFAPQASMTDIVTQTKEALRYIIQYAKNRGSRSIFLGGHSAGGHLAAMLLSHDWDQEMGDGTAAIFKGVLLICGVYDLRALVDTYVNEPLSMSEAEAWKQSPWNPQNLQIFVNNCQKNKIQILVAIGENDSPEFRRQSQEYNTVLRENGIQTKYIDIKNRDHFDAADSMSDGSYILTQELLEMMGASNH